MSSKVKDSNKPLVLSFLTGLCGNATLATLTSSEVAFSVFPIIAFGLAVYTWYQVYMTTAIDSRISKSSVGLFVVGVLIYTVFLRIDHPDLGSNFLPIIIILGLLIWIANNLGVFSVKKNASEKEVGADAEKDTEK